MKAWLIPGTVGVVLGLCGGVLLGARAPGREPLPPTKVLYTIHIEHGPTLKTVAAADLGDPLTPRDYYTFRETSDCLEVLGEVRGLLIAEFGKKLRGE